MSDQIRIGHIVVSDSFTKPCRAVEVDGELEFQVTPDVAARLGRDGTSLSEGFTQTLTAAIMEFIKPGASDVAPIRIHPSSQHRKALVQLSERSGVAYEDLARLAFVMGVNVAVERFGRGGKAGEVLDLDQCFHELLPEKQEVLRKGAKIAGEALPDFLINAVVDHAEKLIGGKGK